ncbi:MAG TPA: glycosyltransferase family 39 protein [Solirubrobacteraceae bacterium]|nr:glycosyltransferase family 39 protein [Solirubrobacteraceae bacterium]
MAARPRARRILIIAVVLIVALALRIGEVQRTDYDPINDAGSYLTLAAQIARTGDYASSTGAGGTRGPSAYYPPGFPYLLAAVDLIDGRSVPRDGAVHPARLSQAVLGTGIVALVGLVAYESFGETIGLLALGLGAIYPALIELSAVLVAENLLTLLVLSAVWAMLRAGRSAHPYRWIAAAGGLTGLATLTHINGLVLFLPLGFAAWRLRRTVSAELPHPFAAPAVFLVSAFLIIAPWTIRNAVELHRFVAVSDEAGITLVGTYNQASAANPLVPYKWRFYSAIPGERALVRASKRLTEPTLSGRLESQALDYIGAHPLAPLAALYHNTLRLLELEGSYAWEASAGAIDLSSATARVGVISFWALCVLALAGLFTRAPRTAPRWLWWVPLLLWLSVALINAETPRFREPIDAFLIMLAACALAALAHRAAARLPGAPARRRDRPPVARGPGQLVEMVKRLA